MSDQQIGKNTADWLTLKCKSEQKEALWQAKFTEVLDALRSLVVHCAESHYADCAYLCDEDSICDCGSAKVWNRATELLENYNNLKADL